MAIAGSIIVSFVVSSSIAGFLVVVTGGFAICSVTYTLFFGIKNDVREARIFLYSSSPLVILGMLEMFIVMGLFPSFPHHEWLVMSGMFFLVIAQSFRLTDKVLHMQRTHGEIQQAKAEAKAVQDSLMSHETHIGPSKVYSFYRSADATGGDWFGHFYDEVGGRVYLFIGDVTGHGMPAALVAAAVAGAVQATISNLSEESLPLAESLDKLAKIADKVVKKAGRGEGGHWMSMAFLVIDEKTLAGAYLNAGHPQVYHMKKWTVKSDLR